MTTMGKFRHFSQLSTSKGHFVVLAIDHRSNLLERLNQVTGHDLTDEEFIAFKQSLVTNLTTSASGVLADPTYSIGLGVTSGAIHGQLGLISPVEVTDYDLHPSRRGINFIPHWSVKKIKMMGGDGIKLLLPYNPESESFQELMDVVQDIIDDCTTYDIPFFLEPIPYSLTPNVPLQKDVYLEMYLEMCKRFCDMGVDALKLPFPVDHKQSQDEDEWREACQMVTNICTVPWALLSAGVNFDTFLRQARIACQAGTSGVIVGRAVWAEAVELQGRERSDFLATIAADRMYELATVCAESARSWQESVEMPDISFGWQESYQED